MFYKIDIQKNEAPALPPVGSQCAGDSSSAWLEQVPRRIPKSSTVSKGAGFAYSADGRIVTGLLLTFRPFFRFLFDLFSDTKR